MKFNTQHMKTNIYLLILPALFFSLSFKAQTASISSQGKTEGSETKILTRLGSGSNDSKSSAIKSVSTVKPVNNGQNTNAGSDLKGPEAQMFSLQKQAEDLSLKAQKMRDAAKSKPGPEKTPMLLHAKEIDKQAMTKQIEASEISGVISQHKFSKNKLLIQALINFVKGEANISHHSKFLIDDSEKNMKVALQLRDEAKTMRNLPSKLGNMSNAEEKELLALNQQDEAIDILGNRKMSMR